MTTSPSAATGTKDHLLESTTMDNDFTKPKSITVSTKYGVVVVTQQGPVNRPVIVTFHDIAYNSATQFHEFFSFPEMMPVTGHFTIYHINAPGQDENANALPASFTYPSMDQLAICVNDVFGHLNIKSAIGFGIGLGANVLARFALQYPSKMYGLVMINCIGRSTKWLEGLSVKRSLKDSNQDYWSEPLVSYLTWYHLGSEAQSSDRELVDMLQRHLSENVRPRNVIKILDSFFKRTSIPLDRQNDPGKKSNPAKTLQCSVLNITGATSPHKEDVIDLSDRCNSSTSSYVEFADCGGAVLFEQPSKLAESIRLFLQGLGYMSHLSIPNYSTSNRLAEQTAEYKRRHGSLAKVPRRYTSQVQQDYTSNYEHDFDDEPRARAGSFTHPTSKGSTEF